MGKTMVNIRVRLEYQRVLKEISDKSGIAITTLAEIAIKRISRVDLSDLIKVRKDKEDAYERAIQRLSDEIAPVLPVLPKKDAYDKTASQEPVIKDKPISKPKKQEIKAIMSDKPATRIDEDDIKPDANGEIDIDDILDPDGGI